jgi:diaminopimelate epimerase
LISRQGGRYTFRAAMGQPERVVEEQIEAAGETLTVTTLAIGNPQCVALMQELPDLARFNRLGPRCPRTSAFPDGTNVEFAVVEAPGSRAHPDLGARRRPTHASGTGACASAIRRFSHGGAARDVQVIAPGGTQRVEWRDDGVFLTGWAEVVFDGHWLPSTADLA